MLDLILCCVSLMLPFSVLEWDAGQNPLKARMSHVISLLEPNSLPNPGVMDGRCSWQRTEDMRGLAIDDVLQSRYPRLALLNEHLQLSQWYHTLAVF